MSYHHRKKRRAGLKKHHRVLIFIAVVVVILYALDWVGGDWIASYGHRHRWVDATPSGPSGHR